MRFIYSTLFTLALPIIFFRLWYRGRKQAAYRQRWRERLGIFNTAQLSTNKTTIWLHTVSVGEFLAAKALIHHLQARPHTQLVITTMTPTGSQQVIQNLGHSVFHVYAPYDLPLFIHQFLNRVKPDICIIMETELWPNILHLCKQQNIPTLIANARLSEKSARGYGKIANLTKTMLANVTHIAAQDDATAQRFLHLGLAEHKTTVTGSIKFDVSLGETLTQQAHNLKSQYSNRSKSIVFIAASTHQGEDEIILRAFLSARANHPTLRLIIVPRHPERFEYVFKLCKDTQLNISRRSASAPLTTPLGPFDIILGDTMGEMLMLFGCADIAFIGGSFVENGGHNYIEPALWGLPILSGPSTYNFHDIAEKLTAANGLSICAGDKELARELSHLAANSTARQQQGHAAWQVAEQNRGALKRLLDLIDEITPQHK